MVSNTFGEAVVAGLVSGFSIVIMLNVLKCSSIWNCFVIAAFALMLIAIIFALSIWILDFFNKKKKWSFKGHRRIALSLFVGLLFTTPLLFQPISFAVRLQIASLPIILGGLMAAFGRKSKEKREEMEEDKRTAEVIRNMGGESYGWLLISSGLFLLIATIVGPILTILFGKYAVSIGGKIFYVTAGRVIFWIFTGGFLTCLIRVGIGSNAQYSVRKFLTDTG